jgi:riboflavin kinase/FMN adenylyltransferase
MKLLRGFTHLSELEQGAAVTIGNFDGVHRGHQALLANLCQKAACLKLPTLIVFFEPQPSEYFSQTPAPVRLMTRKEKLRYLARFNIDYVYCLTFNEKLASMTHDFFAERFIFSLFKAKYLLIGEDFRFGRGRLGTPQFLQSLSIRHNCIIELCPDFVDERAMRISSTQIRHALSQGNLQQAKKHLGRPYSMSGRVIHGDKRGRLLGVPTANIQIKHRNVSLAGVFLVQAQRSDMKSYWGVANVGLRPTVDGATQSLEVHLFDFNGSLYDEYLEVFFLERLRMEKKFSCIDALITQIHADRDNAKDILATRLSSLNYLNIE